MGPNLSRVNIVIAQKRAYIKLNILNESSTLLYYVSYKNKISMWKIRHTYMENSERKKTCFAVQEKDQLMLDLIDQGNNMAKWIAEKRIGEN